MFANRTKMFCAVLVLATATFATGCGRLRKLEQLGDTITRLSVVDSNGKTPLAVSDGSSTGGASLGTVLLQSYPFELSSSSVSYTSWSFQAKSKLHLVLHLSSFSAPSSSLPSGCLKLSLTIDGSVSSLCLSVPSDGATSDQTIDLSGIADSLPAGYPLDVVIGLLGQPSGAVAVLSLSIETDGAGSSAGYPGTSGSVGTYPGIFGWSCPANGCGGSYPSVPGQLGSAPYPGTASYPGTAGYPGLLGQAGN